MEGEGRLTEYAMVRGNPKWEFANQREGDLDQREDDIRDNFERDYCRILHSTGYRRLKHKTQVFFATSHDHICTRMEHVSHVASVSYTIAKYLGLNTDLVSAIAIGHDIGHAPFGHAGEKILEKIAKKEKLPQFWHEKNSLRFVDSVELLENTKGFYDNLLLTYAVRDGIVCHCGEAEDDEIMPRDDCIDLTKIEKDEKIKPYTWEGCVVKIADKVSYLGRDIEDASTLKILSNKKIRDFLDIAKIVKDFGIIKEGQINNTILLHSFIADLCASSSFESGIRLSDDYKKLLKDIMDFNNENIYSHDRLSTYKAYVHLIITSIFNQLKSCYKKIK